MTLLLHRLRFFFLYLSLYAFASLASPETQCVDCHKQAISDWQHSDHAKAMDKATANSVLGDFSGVSVSHYSQTAKFYKNAERFLIEFTEGKSTETYSVSYTFGHYPLQQYLVAAPGGRYQVFPFAWDSRTEADGGQRWYPIYATEDIQTADRLHWQQPLQNWNGMCADCHSDGLKRNYRPETNTFNTLWDNINVGCQSCHGKMDSQHYSHLKQNSALLNAKEMSQIGRWLLAQDDDVASWQGDKRDNGFMDTCFACHSLRSPLTDGLQPTQHLLDQVTPTLLRQPFYYPDGQIKEEVYVYGSFLQSKMYAAGVNCLDCHDNHTMKVKANGNGLCLQCHNSEVYQADTHLNHPPGSEAAQCVSCHMPETTYMGTDARRDHSFKVPRPALSIKFNTPNACNGCHEDKDANWASQQVVALWGNKHPLTENQRNYILLQHQQYLSAASHLAIVNDKSLSEIVRASALVLLPNSINPLRDGDVKPWINSPQPLLRLATAQVGYALPASDKKASYLQLLNDKYKAVRVAAARHLVPLNINSPDMLSALSELLSAAEETLWRGEGALNHSLVQLNANQMQEAITTLHHAINVDPYFDAAYVNLADIYRQTHDIDNEKTALQKGLSANPDSSTLHYSFAMHLIRQKKKSAAIKHLQQAIEIEPNNLQFAYVYFVALDNVGETQKALAQLTMALPKYNNHPQLVDLGLRYARKIGDNPAFEKLSSLLNQ